MAISTCCCGYSTKYLSVLLCCAIFYFRETFRNCWFLAMYKYRKTENKGKESHTFSLLLLQKGEICTCNDNHHETKIEMGKKHVLTARQQHKYRCLFCFFFI
jgi:hypothetical protein